MKKMEADVIIIGGGASGITAAVAAAEKDASVIVFEKGLTTGGAANMGMGLFAVESKYQKAQMIDMTKEEVFRFFMEYTHWRVDARLVRRYIEQSANTIEWIESMGIQFLGAYKYFEKSKPTWHIVKTPNSNTPAERSATLMFKTLTERASELGVKLCFETQVMKICMENGVVTGVLAKGSDGEEIEAESSCVIVASGGFGDNPDMISRYGGYEWGKDLFSFRIPGVRGEGLNMMWDSGAAKASPVMELTYTTPGITDVFKTLSETMRQPGLMVNLDGKRFINEEIMSNTTFTGNALTRQKQRCGFTIVDESIIDSYRETGLDYITFHHNIHNVDKWDAELQTFLSGAKTEASGLSELHSEALKQSKNFFAADSLEDLCEQTGIDIKDLKETIGQYNEFACSEDSQFFKKHGYVRPLKGGKLYAARHYPAGYGSLGGVAVNDKLEVLNDAGDKIPGLYACGIDACGIFGDSYCFYLPGNTMGFAINSGRIAGGEAIDYIDSDDFVEI